jgi:hypothetical protein
MKWVAVLIAIVATSFSTPSYSTTSNEYVRVTGKGVTSRQAKEEGFQTAIELAVGTLIVSDKKVVNNKLIRQDIGAHSAGYILDFVIITESQTHTGEFIIVMDVKVHTSKIHQRLLSTGNNSSSVNGDKLFEQYRTYNESKDSAHKIFDQIMMEYPSKAFVVTNPKINCGDPTRGSFCFKLTNTGNAVLQIPYTVRWNYNFLLALHEVLQHVSDQGNQGEKFTIISKAPGSIFGSTVHYNFNDTQRLRQIKSKFLGDVYVHAKVLDHQGTTLYNTCAVAYSVPHIDYRGFIIQGNAQDSESMFIEIDRSDKISRAHQIDLSVSRTRC